MSLSWMNKISKMKTCKLSNEVRTALKVSNKVFGYSVQYKQRTVKIYFRCNMVSHSFGKKKKLNTMSQSMIYSYFEIGLKPAVVSCLTNAIAPPPIVLESCSRAQTDWPV